METNLDRIRQILVNLPDSEEEEESEVEDLDEEENMVLREEDDEDGMEEDEDDEVGMDEDELLIWREENPYEIVEGTPGESVQFKVVANEIIHIATGTGYCCLCQEIRSILYTDNSFGTNVASQLCQHCITGMMIRYETNKVPTRTEMETTDG